MRHIRHLLISVAISLMVILAMYGLDLIRESTLVAVAGVTCCIAAMGLLTLNADT